MKITTNAIISTLNPVFTVKQVCFTLISKILIALAVLLILGANAYANSSIDSNSATDQIYINNNYYGPVKESDDLWQIAKRFRPNNSVTIEKTAVAIFNLNQRAFSHHNLNGLMSGYFLELPSLEQIKAVKEQGALDLIHKQNKEWLELANQKALSEQEAQTQVQEPEDLFDESNSNDEEARANHSDSNIEEPETELTSSTNPVYIDARLADSSISNNSNVLNDVNDNHQPEQIEQSADIETQSLTIDNSELRYQLEELESENEKLAHIIQQQNEVIEQSTTQDQNTQHSYSSSSFRGFLEEKLLNNPVIENIEKHRQWLIIIGLVLVVIILMIIKRRISAKRRIIKAENAPSSLSKEMLDEFTGDNVYDTQLDLATAYIALKRYDEAIPLLQAVISTGEPEQASYAQSLIDAIEQKKSEE